MGYLGVLGLGLICVCFVKFSLWFVFDLGVIGVLQVSKSKALREVAV